MTTKLDTLPKAFVWSRLHSLAGIWLVIFLIEHLVTNSQAALLIGDNGQGFVWMVNFLHNLPYLTVIEVLLLGVPLFLHILWGIRIALMGKGNAHSKGGKAPYLKYGRNRFYSLQRITSWILVVLLVMHIVKFRFLEYPKSVQQGDVSTYFVKVTMDPGLYTVAQRLGVTIIDAKAWRKLQTEQEYTPKENTLLQTALQIEQAQSQTYNQADATILQSAQKLKMEYQIKKAVAAMHLKDHQVIASSPNFGTASLLAVRNTFKSPMWVGIYTLFVVSACFHAFNGLWTSMLTWGWVIRVAAQTRARQFAIGLMLIVTFLGLAAVWGTYFLNLKH